MDEVYQYWASATCTSPFGWWVEVLGGLVEGPEARDGDGAANIWEVSFCQAHVAVEAAVVTDC